MCRLAAFYRISFLLLLVTVNFFFLLFFECLQTLKQICVDTIFEPVIFDVLHDFFALVIIDADILN